MGQVLNEMEAEGLEMPSASAAVRLVILTGCRLNEIMTLKWNYVDLGAGTLNLPDSKTCTKVVSHRQAGGGSPPAASLACPATPGSLPASLRAPACPIYSLSGNPSALVPA